MAKRTRKTIKPSRRYDNNVGIGLITGLGLPLGPDKTDENIERSLRILEEEGKRPPKERFNDMVKAGLIDRHGRLDRSHVEETTLGELTRLDRGARRRR